MYPEALVEICILASTKPGDIVFDPFTGSGTTGVVAVKNHRKFIGCDLVQKYQEMAQERINTFHLNLIYLVAHKRSTEVVS